MEKLIFLAIGLFVCLPFFSETAGYETSKPNFTFTIVIDPGHGGKDSGALGSKVYEKDIALKIALKLGKYIDANLSNIRVLYTRTTDEFVPLHTRVALANDNNADIFFSIHCNAMLTRPSPTNGTETYVMGLHNAKENLDVAKRENKVVLLEQDYNNNYDGYDPNS
ncbi:N-acetylmuramoyl-L-alanine amidase, partial [Aureispira]|nr:N-acetylmuramoyl-L-alanine amidase [Aureispira sp.]